MKNLKAQGQNFPEQSHLQGKAIVRHRHNVSNQSDKDLSQKDKASQYCIERCVGDIQPRDFLPIVQSFLPASYELFSKVVEDCELWQKFRQKAAEAFCKADKTYFLVEKPLFPFLYLYIEESYNHRHLSWKYFPSKLSVYTLSDLAEIAEEVVGEQL